MIPTRDINQAKIFLSIHVDFSLVISIILASNFYANTYVLAIFVYCKWATLRIEIKTINHVSLSYYWNILIFL